MATIRTSVQLHDNMSRAFGAINNAMSATINSFEHLHRASGNAMDLSSIEIARRELARAEQAFSEIETQISQAGSQQNNFNNSIQNGNSAANALLSKMLAIVGAYLSLQSAMKIIQLSDEMTSTTARVQLLVDEMPLIPDQQANVDFKALGMSDIEGAQQLIYESAQRSYSSFKDTADMVSRIGTNAGDAFGSVAEVVAFSEIVQKQFGIAGANANEASNATLQLSQALASGVLRGDELNSIFEQAPNLIHSIADYMDKPIGKIREMAADGMITADIVKNAMFAAADEVNQKFDSMPITWGNLWTYFQNGAQRTFGNVLGYINKIANSERMKEFVDGMISNLAIIASVAMSALQAMTTVGSFLYDNWFWLGPIILGVAGALSVLTGYLALVRTWTLLAAAGQWVLNAAMTANPIGLVIAGIVLLIGLFYTAIATLNHFAGTSISATGIIAGTFMVLDAFLHNVIAGWWNLFASLVEFWVNVWTESAYSTRRLFGNLANTALDMAISMIGNFDNAATNLANLFINGANMAIRAINEIKEALNQIPGIDLGKSSEIQQRHSLVADYSGLKNKINDWVGETPEGYWEAPKMEMKNLGTAWNTGSNWGANLFNTDSLEKVLTKDYGALASLANLDNIASTLNDIADKAKDTAKNTAATKDKLDMSGNDLKYLRDLAESRSINRYTTEIKVDMTNNNNINSEMDIDGIVDRFGEKVEEVVSVLAEGDDMDI